MAGSQAENFTVPWASRAPNTPSEGAVWPARSHDAPAQASLTTFPSFFLFPSCTGPHVSFFLRFQMPYFLAPVSLKPSPEGEILARWPLQTRRCLGVPGSVDCWWLAKAGFYILAQSSGAGLWPLVITLCIYIVSFLSGTVSALQEWSYWSSQQPSEVWQWEEVPAPSFLKRVKPRGLLWGCVTSLHLSWVAYEVSQNWRHLYWGTGRNGEKAWHAMLPYHAAVSPGARAKPLNFFFTKWFWKIVFGEWSFGLIDCELPLCWDILWCIYLFLSLLFYSMLGFSHFSVKGGKNTLPEPRNTAASRGKCP